MNAAHARWLLATYLLVELFASFPSRANTSDGRSLVRRSYILNSEIEAELLSAYAQETAAAKRQRKTMARGPGRHFLEARGIPFPYRATALLRDDNRRLVVENSPVNLAQVDLIFEELYRKSNDSSSIAALIEAARSQYGEEVFSPSPELLASLDMPEVAAKSHEPSPRKFDPRTMDYETLAHGGAVYTNVVVQGSNEAELRIMHQSGGATLPLAELAPEIQKRFSYDPAKAADFLERRRQASLPPPTPAPRKMDAKVAQADSQPEAERASVYGASKDNQAGGASYTKILCRDGRTFKSVAVSKTARGFEIRPAESRSGRGELVDFRDAPAELLLDFEEFEELFRRAVVANARTQLYEMSSNEVAEGTTYEDLAKAPRPGSSFVSVPEGYLFAEMGWINLPASTVELVVPLGSRTFAVADVGNLVGLTPSRWWNDYAGHGSAGLPVPAQLEQKEPTKLGVLYSPFNSEAPILGNTTGEMKRLWVDREQGEHGALALVETGNGLFFGYYQEHAALEASDLTWEDATREKSGRFSLTKVRSQRVKPGESFLKLFDASARKVLGAEFKELGQLKLGGQHFFAMLQKGVEAAVQDRILPKGDGVEFPESGVISTSSPALDKVVIIDQVDAKLKDILPHAYVFDIESKQRVTEIRKTSQAGSRTKFDKMRPQRRKQTEVVEVPPDLDGGLRLTDGKRVYELKPGVGGTELIVWEAEPNKLKRL